MAWTRQTTERLQLVAPGKMLNESLNEPTVVCMTANVNDEQQGLTSATFLSSTAARALRYFQCCEYLQHEK